MRSILQISGLAMALLLVACGPKVSVTISPATANVYPASTQTFTATVKGSSNTAVTWSVQEAAGGSIATDGTYTAPTTAGTYHVVATSKADKTKSATATVNVSLSGLSVSVSPPSATIKANGTQRFTATVTNSDAGVTWSLVEADAGTVDSSGLYTASSSTGVFHVRAASTRTSAANAQATVTVLLPDGPTVGGTVGYAGAKTGRIYVEIQSSSCNSCSASNGTSLGAPGAYTIRGVQMTGTLTLFSFMDTLGTGEFVAGSDPSGSTTVGYSGSTVTGANITLTDPTGVVPSTPTISGGQPSTDTVILFYKHVTDANGNELASQYNVYYGPFTGNCAATVWSAPLAVPTGSKGFPAFVSGLTNSSQYCFAMTAVISGVESPKSSAVGPATVTAPASVAGTSYTVSGTVSFPSVTAGGALWAILYNPSNNSVRYQRVGSPVSPQAFSITGVPAGSYVLAAVYDVNANGQFDVTDPNNIVNGGDQATVTISADTSGLSTTIPTANALAQVATQYGTSGPGSPSYSLNFQVGANQKLPVAATVGLGPNLTSEIDMGTSQDQGGRFQTYLNLGSAVPAVGQTYSFLVTYADGTTETLTAAVTGVFTSLPTALSPNGSNLGGVATPTFSWAAPSPAPSSYSYRLQVSPSGGNMIWEAKNISQSTLSVVYDYDGSASQASLTAGTVYNWSLQVQDAFGNQCQAQASFTD